LQFHCIFHFNLQFAYLICIAISWFFLAYLQCLQFSLQISIFAKLLQIAIFFAILKKLANQNSANFFNFLLTWKIDCNFH